MAYQGLREDEKMEASLKWPVIRRLLGRFVSYKKEVAVVLLLMGIVIAINSINPIILKIAIDDYAAKGKTAGLLPLAGLTLAINLFSRWATKWRILKMSEVANDILMHIRQELYRHLQSLSFTFFDNRPVGKILARVVGDVNSLKDMLINSVTSLIPDLVQVAVVLVIMLVLNAKLAIAAVVFLPMLVATMYFVQIKAHRRWQVYRKKNATMNAYVHEDFSGIKVVQSYSAEGQTSGEFEKILTEHRKSFISAARLNAFFWPLTELSWGIGNAAVFMLGVRLNLQGELEIGTLLAFTSYIGMFWQPIMNLSNFYNQLVTNLAGAERIFDILDTEPDIKDSEEAIELDDVEGEVVFENVTFSYDNENIVLKDLSFTVEKGSTVALVGPTGAGKTTIVNLLSRFYETRDGKILLDGQDVRSVTMESLRKRMGIMTQDTFLFTGTVRENIRYGRLDATDQEIEAAAKAVSAHDFIMSLPEGYETDLNERGTRLSVGQRQLIAFARTILSEPRILILDEATSSIDTHTERAVQKGIETLLKGRTSFVIAHRLSTIKRADRIFVVDGQGIVESGSHDELLEMEGLYHKLYLRTAQMLG